MCEPTSREPCPFMTMSELNSEECNKSMDVIISTTVQLEWRTKGKIFLFDCVQINFLQKKKKTINYNYTQTQKILIDWMK